MLNEHIDEMIREFEGSLQQQRLSLDEYLRLTNSSKDELREQYRERATESLRHNLVLRELVSAQAIEITDDDLELRLNSVIAGYGASPELRKLFDTPQMRGNIRNELVMNHLNAHLAAIGRGEDPSTAIEDMKSRMIAEAERARERGERLRRYRQEDAAGGDDTSTRGDSAESPLPADEEESLPASESSAEIASPNSGASDA